MTTLLSPRIHIFAAEFNLEVGQVTAHTPPRIIQFWQFLRRTGFSVQCPSYTTNHTRMRPWRCVVSSVSHQPSPDGFVIPLERREKKYRVVALTLPGVFLFWYLQEVMTDCVTPGWCVCVRSDRRMSGPTLRLHQPFLPPHLVPSLMS